MSAVVTVRPFTDADAEAAAALDTMVFTRTWTAKQYVEEIDLPDRDYLVAEVDGRFIGCAGAWDAPDMTHVMTLAVTPDVRRQGVGRRLMEELLARSAARGAAAWTLEVRADNLPAQALYANLGFEVVGRRPNYYDMVRVAAPAGASGEGVARDAILMTRTQPVEVVT